MSARRLASPKSIVNSRRDPEPDTLSPSNAEFLSAYRECGSLKRASDRTGISKGNHQYWLKKSPAYVAAFKEAYEHALKHLKPEDRTAISRGFRPPTARKGDDIYHFYLSVAPSAAWDEILRDLKSLCAKHDAFLLGAKYMRRGMATELDLIRIGRRREPISQAMSGMIKYHLKKRGKLKGKRLSEILKEFLGYDLATLRRHLTAQFAPGMSWKNFGDWQIDHKVPASWFKIESLGDAGFCECWALSNLQPKWRSENAGKCNHYADDNGQLLLIQKPDTKGGGR